MTSVRPDLKGVERAKFFQALIERINNVCDVNTIGENVNRLVNTFANPNQSLPPSKMKKCQRLAERSSVSCVKVDDGRREYIVRRLKFAKRAVDSREDRHNFVVPATVESQSSESHPSSTTRFENTKRKLLEIEKEKLRELYGRSNSRERSDNAKNDVPMISDQCLPQICDEKPPDSSRSLEEMPSEVSTSNAAEITYRAICIPALEYNMALCENAIGKLPNVEKSNCIIDTTNNTMLDMRDNITASNQEGRALQSVGNETVSTSNLSTQISVSSNRRSRRRQLRRRLPCAHCHQPISEVSFFNGVQQLCNECADNHFERVTRARLKDRPMSYREFKNVGGDTIYARVCEQCPK